ncbi:MAG: hypothetical protein FWF51_13285 [Chitinivibrionia bacterium]|nr:hypothetical protein [Chitinivibrionia bacterium]
MSYEVIVTKRFERELKRLLKKYKSLKFEYAKLIDNIEKDSCFGEAIGNNCYKIRVKIASKQKGKSGGARVISFVYTPKEKVYLLAIYDKSDISNMGENVIDSRISELEL